MFITYKGHKHVETPHLRAYVVDAIPVAYHITVLLFVFLLICLKRQEKHEMSAFFFVTMSFVIFNLFFREFNQLYSILLSINHPLVLRILYTTSILIMGLHLVLESEYEEKLAPAVQNRSTHTHKGKLSATGSPRPQRTTQGLKFVCTSFTGYNLHLTYTCMLLFICKLSHHDRNVSIKNPK